ncbi:hypothetical protein C7I87_28255 [Mesorhizobium sp. SARCC-RB16n]|uniref:hypothetical protein n=1 Tax=Mesorhizobium sp. SARCC-RB16n TaxID=2116687 RepID=UPI00122EC983|nr:hypothetical protein [Mesorhizobium sp. SARCC-RB16n]KAA3447149.1 hypothetical protein C7I87_28255 [Mesorhizobium sp. SARCC-RB16n]
MYHFTEDSPIARFDRGNPDATERMVRCTVRNQDLAPTGVPKDADFLHPMLSASGILHRGLRDIPSLGVWREAASAYNFELLTYHQFKAGAPETKTVPRQAAMTLSGSYSPSKSVLTYWFDGLRQFAPAGEFAESERLMSWSDEAELAAEFGRRLVSLFGSFVQQKRGEHPGTFALVQDGRVDAHFQVAVCERFWIVPDQCSAFLNALATDLLANLSGGVEVSGEWGRMSATGTSVRVRLEPLRKIAEQSFVRAVRTE